MNFQILGNHTTALSRGCFRNFLILVVSLITREYVCTARITTNHNRVGDSVHDTPCLSMRRRAQFLNFSQTTERLLKEVKLYSYHLSLLEELKPSHYLCRVNFCRQVIHDGENNISIFYTFFNSNEACFHLDAYINSQNYRIWASGNLYVSYETRLHPLKIGVWCTISHHRIVGPIFFELRITANVHRGIMKQFIALFCVRLPKRSNIPVASDNHRQIERENNAGNFQNYASPAPYCTLECLDPNYAFRPTVVISSTFCDILLCFLLFLLL